MKVLSLFSGVGGFDLGLERAGMETVGLCEWDKHAQSVLRHHWPNVPQGPGISQDGEPMFTLTATDRHAVAAGAVVRRLTPLECERLMGWPDGWTRYAEGGREQADTHRYKQIGNGVASPVAEWVGRHIMAAEHGAP